MTSYDEVVLVGGRILRVHPAEKCAGQTCAVHNPSDHPLNHAPFVWRSDRALMERECEHRIGHPDPDGVAFIQRTQGVAEARVAADHGCDGCCYTPLPVEFVKREIPRKPRLLPLVKWLDSRRGKLLREWVLCLVLVCFLLTLFGSNSGYLFVEMLFGATYYLSTTFLIRHYKHHHSQYFRRSNP